MNKAEYARYRKSSWWLSRSARRIALANGQCEFRPEIDYGRPDKGPFYGERCTKTTGLQVHHLNYGPLRAEKDSDLEVLCGFHHVVRHVMGLVCDVCSDMPIVTDEDEAIALVEEACQSYDVSTPTLDMIDVDTTCWHCEDMFATND